MEVGKEEVSGCVEGGKGEWERAIAFPIPIPTHSTAFYPLHRRTFLPPVPSTSLPAAVVARNEGSTSV